MRRIVVVFHEEMKLKAPSRMGLLVCDSAV